MLRNAIGQGTPLRVKAEPEVELEAELELQAEPDHEPDLGSKLVPEPGLATEPPEIEPEQSAHEIDFAVCDPELREVQSVPLPPGSSWLLPPPYAHGAVA